MILIAVIYREVCTCTRKKIFKYIQKLIYFQSGIKNEMKTHDQYCRLLFVSPCVSLN